MAVFTIVTGDDWSGLYVDGALAEQGHELRVPDVLEIAKINGPVTEVATFEADYRWLEDEGSLPFRLEQVKRASWDV